MRRGVLTSRVWRTLGLAVITAAAAGIGAAAHTIPPAHALASILLWPLIGLGLALLAFRKVTP